MSNETKVSTATYMYKALECLYLAAEHSVAADVGRAVKAHVDELQSEIAEMRKVADKIIAAEALSLAAKQAGPPFPPGVCDECGGAIVWLQGNCWHAGAPFGQRTWHTKMTPAPAVAQTEGR